MDKKNKTYLAVFAFGVTDPDKSIIHISPAQLWFLNETEPMDFPLQKVLTNREDMHKFVDNFFDKLEQSE